MSLGFLVFQLCFNKQHICLMLAQLHEGEYSWTETPVCAAACARQPDKQGQLL